MTLGLIVTGSILIGAGFWIGYLFGWGKGYRTARREDRVNLRILHGEIERLQREAAIIVAGGKP